MEKAVFGTFCYVLLLHKKKCPKRPFRGVLEVKLTSTTPLNIGFYTDIIESLGKSWTFLLNKLKILAIFPPHKYYSYYINFGRVVLSFLTNNKTQFFLWLNLVGSKVLCVKSARG